VAFSFSGAGLTVTCPLGTRAARAVPADEHLRYWSADVVGRRRDDIA
jgi:hypothetical protein